MSDHPPVGIVGAGLTGLCLARSLWHARVPCFVVDKGRRPGGRMATMMVGDEPIDYGPGWFHTSDDTMLPEVRRVHSTLPAECDDPEDMSPETRSRLPASDRIRS